MRILLVAFLFYVVFLLLLSSSMHTPLNHDEHQFVASGMLFAKGDIMPFIDYPYFHMPYLVFMYGFIFKYFSCLLLSARMISVVSSLLILLSIFILTLQIFNKYSYFFRILIAAGFLSILLNNPIFIYTTNLSWNHALPTWLILIAFVLYCSGSYHISPKRYMLFSGIFVGLATGIRLSFAIIPAPFIAMIFLFPKVNTLKDKMKLMFLFCLGFFLALLPAMVKPINVLPASPKNTFFLLRL